MAVDEQRVRIRRSLEEKLGVEEATYLIERRDDLVTKEYLDLRLDAIANGLRVEFRDQTTRMLKWLVPTIFTGMTVSTGLVAGIAALV